MQSYTINLLRSKERRAHVDKQISHYPFISNQYVEGVDASLLSERELMQKFDIDLAISRYGRSLKKGEIGCTLSHRKCYDLLLKSVESSAIIFEDDILIRNFDVALFYKIQSLLDEIKYPCVLLLSGSFWYSKKRCFYAEYHLANVYSAYFTHSYIINRLAASTILKMPPSYLADDWWLMRNNGIKVLGISPHLVDQKEFISTIDNGERGIIKNKLSFTAKCTAYKEGITKKILQAIGHYEQKTH